MPRRDEESQPRRLLFDGRIENRLHVDSPRKQRPRKPEGIHRVAENNGHDGRAARRPRVEPRFLGEAEEEPGIVMQFRHPRGIAIEEPQCTERRSRRRRRQADGVDKAWHRVLEPAHERVGAGDVAAAAPQGLRERAHPKIDVGRLHAEVLADAAAARAHHADRVGLVHHQERLVPLGDPDELRQVGEVAVHAVDALDHHEHAPILATDLGEELLGSVEIVVRERPAAGPGEHGTLQETVVGERVVEHEVAGADDVADHRLVRRMAADKRDRVFRAHEPGDFPLELLVDHLLARHEPACRHARAVAIERRLRGERHLRLTRHAEIVVGGPAHHLAAADLRAVGGQALVDAEVGVFEAGVPHHREVLLEGPDLREVFDAERVARDIRNHFRRLGPLGAVERHVVENCLGHLAAGLDLRQHLLGEPAAERLLEAGHDLHALERVEAQLDDVGVEREVARPLLGDSPHMIEHRLHHVLRQVAVGPQCP